MFVSAIFPPQLFKHGLLHGIARAFTVEEHERVRPGQTQGKRTVRVWVRLRAQKRLGRESVGGLQEKIKQTKNKKTKRNETKQQQNNNKTNKQQQKHKCTNRSDNLVSRSSLESRPSCPAYVKVNDHGDY